MTPLFIPNNTARHMWMANHGLAAPPTGPLDVMGIIRALGFVQIDTIRNVTRAHNHIIWSRNQAFREGDLWPHLRERRLFEHFTHDASLIPSETLPYWQGQFQRLGDQVARNKWYQSGLAHQQIKSIHARIEAEGPLSTHAFDTKIEGPREMWARPPHKKVLDQMWYAGKLATSHREKFVKFYDLGERVFSTSSKNMPPDQATDWLNRQALARLGFASLMEIRQFWGAVSAVDAKAWAANAADLIPVEIESADGTQVPSLAAPDIEARLAALSNISNRMRLLNPFDPMIRNRTRLERLFGFEYRNEMFVPKAKRIWGYYVYPLMVGTRFVGRIELKADRAESVLRVTGFWTEPGRKWSAAQTDRLDGELARFARFAGLEQIEWLAKRPMQP